MGQISPPRPAMLILAAFSRHDDALDWACDQSQQRFGPIALKSPRFLFSETDYYRPTMGPGLQKQFFVFSPPLDPAQLPGIKRLTNQWEEDYAALGAHPEPRPLNLDPGYLSLGKLVLASTKDHSHRIYLSDGIYAEVTLYYRDGAWQAREWTFADYRRPDYQAFFSECRESLREFARGEDRR